MNSKWPAAPTAASLDDPRYYLANFRCLLEWVAACYDDLLSDAERAFMRDVLDLPVPAQALLVRMVMRRGETFRAARLDYAEIGDTAAALAPLVVSGWVEEDPLLSLDELFRHWRLAELRTALAGDIRAAGLPASTGKARLREALAARLVEPRRLTQWWPEAPDRIVRITCMDHCERLRLMFFGNLRQDWADFVLAELGMQRYERVPLDPASRAFQRRAEVDAYRHLHQLRERLDVGESADSLWPEVAASGSDEVWDSPWLATRRARLLFQLGREAERHGNQTLALEAYTESARDPGGGGEARIRRLRLLERLGESRDALTLAEAQPSRSDAEGQALARLVPRLRRRLGLAVQPPPPAPDIEHWTLTLPEPAVGVEVAVRDHLQRTECPVHYVENALIGGLFGLLCWEAIFAPLPGAFFHPFQRGPADLRREDFVGRRRERFDVCLAQLEEGSYAATIRRHWHTKHGLASPFVDWQVLDETLLERALACLPAAHLERLFVRLLADIGTNRAGLPDLIQFLPEATQGPRYRLIEVKGPGDRLQDNQRRWMAYFHTHGIPASVCRVRWQTPP
ncbi:VRR-NUC domain-containing protein [Franzmannia pantelleriensis]|uniref:phosphodiesterase I n=1 Tax=Franzmannia pantelleriensis TaxID=48727 RepID=A0A1G9RW39_9GAMM|nr:VRR-NUC domain-containing protein [Halomonas pantelleriensis]SDM27240.1 VRR-NUC domain-containing protein [Halomonas pantelleriensis]